VSGLGPSWVYLSAFVAAAALGFVLTPLVRRVAVAWGVLDQPDPRKIHSGAVPRWGGVAVGIAGTLAVVAAIAASPGLRGVLLAGHGAARWAALAGGVTVILAAGMVDDARGLPAWPKLLLELAAATLVVLAAPFPHAVALGAATRAHEMGALGAVFAVLWIVTLTNAVNMTDVVDGVAGGLGAIAALALGLAAVGLGHVVAAAVLLALGGALIGFLPHNFSRRRIFLGDSGSLVVGFLLGAASLVGLTREDGSWLLLPAMLALGMPLAECGITVLRRTMRAMTIERSEPGGWRERFVLRQGPPRLFTPDARHIPHRLLGLGLSRRSALAVLYGSAGVLGALAVAAVRWPWVGMWGGLAAVVVLAYAATRWWYVELRLIDRGALLPLFTNAFVHSRLTHMAWDASVAAVAFLFTATVMPGAVHDPGQLWLRTLLVAAATLAGLSVARIYRGTYLHAGISEVVRAVRAGLVAALCAWAAWRLVVGEPWRIAAWILFTYLLLTGVVGVRLLYRLFEYLHMRASGGSRRVLIHGAGRPARQALASMLANPALGFEPLGFVDDDPHLAGAELHGYPVYRGGARLGETLTTLGAMDLVLATPGLTPEQRNAVGETCRGAGVRMLSFDVRWDETEETDSGVRGQVSDPSTTLPLGSGIRGPDSGGVAGPDPRPRIPDPGAGVGQGAVGG
jgi:UDP-GlcNAc:undecaprenyl-phosphate GlcNAc-1-phosphate transferase